MSTLAVVATRRDLHLKGKPCPVVEELRLADTLEEAVEIAVELAVSHCLTDSEEEELERERLSDMLSKTRFVTDGDALTIQIVGVDR